MRPAHVQFHTICGNDGAVATDCVGQTGGASAGTRYVTLAQDTGGVLASICDGNWGTALDAMAAQADHLADAVVPGLARGSGQLVSLFPKRLAQVFFRLTGWRTTCLAHHWVSRVWPGVWSDRVFGWTNTASLQTSGRN